MDPISAVGIALSVAGLAGQVFTGCIQCIHFIVNARDLPKDCQYLNIRLRLEQHRLFAWSEASGLLDYDTEETTKILESNVFGLHRSTVIELLVQIKVLFEDFERYQRRHNRLKTTEQADHTSASSSSKAEIVDTVGESPDTLVPLSPRRKKFLGKALSSLKHASNGGPKRLRWATFDKNAFETLLERFSSMNDNMTALLDVRLQNEIYSVTQDTNRGVLQLHHDFADLTQLVKATLVLTLRGAHRHYADRRSLSPSPLSPPPPYQVHRDGHRMQKLHGMDVDHDDVLGMELLAQLARFKAYSESMESGQSPDQLAAEILQLSRNPGAERVAMEIDKSAITLIDCIDDSEDTRCEADYRLPEGKLQRVWIEWKEYEWESPSNSHPSPLIVERVQKLAALLHHQPKPQHFCVPHCLGYFDDASDSLARLKCESRRKNETTDGESEEEEEEEEAYEDESNYRIGFVFAKPPDVSPTTSPISLLALINSVPKPSVTDRIALASALANCILYLHAVNWLHKGLRSHNVVFFPSPSSLSVKSSSSSSSTPSQHHHQQPQQHQPTSSTQRQHQNQQNTSPNPSITSTTTALNLKHKIPFSTPHLSGFDFARPSSPHEPTESPLLHLQSPTTIFLQNLYRHPFTQSPSLFSSPRPAFSKTFDIYAFGVVLVEIALWEPVERILGVDVKAVLERRVELRVASQVRDRLLGIGRDGDVEARGTLDEVGAAMGDTFRDVVRWCLMVDGSSRGEVETSGDERGGEGFKGFEEVVRRLEGIRV